MKKQFSEALEDLIDAYMENLSHDEKQEQITEIVSDLELKTSSLRQELDNTNLDI